MIKGKKFFSAAILLGLTFSLQAQMAIITPEEYLGVVKRHHPWLAQANGEVRMAEAGRLAARGGFDPKIDIGYGEKQLDGTNYYQTLESQVKVPLWIGEVKARFDLTDGQYVNPENQASKGLLTAGIMLPILQGMITDERRTNLKLAQLSLSSAEVQRRLMTNDFVFVAMAAYWQWAYAKELVAMYENATALAQTRMDAVKRSVVLGERPSVDTLDALYLVQERRLLLQEAQLLLQNAALETTLYYLPEGKKIAEMPEGALPVALGSMQPSFLNPDSLVSAQNSFLNSHPALGAGRIKIDALGVERKLKLEKVKPKLNLEYNFLNSLLAKQPLQSRSEPMANYKWGVTFSMPLFLRSERGQVQITDAKLSNARLSLFQKELEVGQKINMAANKLNNTARQFNLYQQMASNQQALVRAETERLAVGESSLFLVNSRESKALEAQQKMLESRLKYAIQELSFRMALGTL